MHEAISLHAQGRLREAEKLFARVLKAAPGNFDALHLLGTIKAQNGQIGEALRLITAALKINPRAPDAWVNLATVMHALKRDADALDCLDKALAIEPDDLQALQNRGSALGDSTVAHARVSAPHASVLLAGCFLLAGSSGPPAAGDYEHLRKTRSGGAQLP